uniref:Lectin, mannose binding 2 like n=1 Tax=Eptatretus burgeri TaxID=7764 RepID=A0A8C4NBI0_EPTBU
RGHSRLMGNSRRWGWTRYLPGGWPDGGPWTPCHPVKWSTYGDTLTLSFGLAYLRIERVVLKFCVFGFPAAGSSERALWDIIGSTMVTSQQVRLTPDQQSKQGAIWNRVPCGLVDWELQVQFKVHGEGRRNLNGDGLALWYTRDQLKLGPVFGNAQNFSGMGIFIDTYYNEGKKTDLQYPYVSVMVNNGTLHYNHDKDGRRTSLGGCPIAVRNVKHDTFISIKYAMQQITVDVEGRHYWKECVEIRNVQLPTGYHFGASATTGDLSDNHDIIAMKVYELSVERSEEERFQDWSNVIPSAELILQRKLLVNDVRQTPSREGILFIFILSICLVFA